MFGSLQGIWLLILICRRLLQQLLIPAGLLILHCLSLIWLRDHSLWWLLLCAFRVWDDLVGGIEVACRRLRHELMLLRCRRISHFPGERTWQGTRLRAMAEATTKRDAIFNACQRVRIEAKVIIP